MATLPDFGIAPERKLKFSVIKSADSEVIYIKPCERSMCDYFPEKENCPVSCPGMLMQNDGWIFNAIPLHLLKTEQPNLRANERKTLREGGEDLCDA